MRYKTRHLMAITVGCVCGIFLFDPVSAQELVATGQQGGATSKVDRATIENYIRVMTIEVDRAEARVGAQTAQLVSLNGDIESRVQRMVSLLSSVRDSTDSAESRMRRAKVEALSGLEAVARYYAQERDRRKKEMNNPYAQISADDLAKDVAALNTGIETCVTQSLEIAKSLVQHQEGEVKKYDDGYSDDNNETREYQRSKRDAEASVKIKTDLVADLRASIEKLSRDIKNREVELSYAADASTKERLSTDIETMRKTIDARRGQVEELLMAPKPSTRAVGHKAAFEMDKMLEEMTKELRQDFAKFRALVMERDMARARVKPLKDRLAGARAMLEPESPSQQ